MESWQVKLDREFPRGALAYWEPPDGGGPEYTYPVPRIEVTGMRGLNPCVSLPVPDWDKVIDGCVLSYDSIQSEPCFVARVVLEDTSRAMHWSAGVSDSLAQRMSARRAELVRNAAERGRSVFAE